MSLELVGALNKLAGTSGQGAGGAANAAVDRFADYPGHVYQQVTETTTLTDVNRIVACTVDSITVTLPTDALEAGAWLIVKDESGAAGGVDNAITITCEGSETIDGASSILLNQNYESVFLYSNGTNWFTAAVAGSIL